jgi:hypothetical protein
VITFSFLNTVSLAQETAFDNYRNSYQNYLNSYEAFSKARDAYKEFETLKSKTDLETTLKNLLIARSQTTISYLQVLQEQVSPSTEYTSLALTEIETDIIWYRENLEELKLKSTLDELMNNSSVFQEYYRTHTGKFVGYYIKLINFHLLNGHYQVLSEVAREYSDKINTLSDSKNRDLLVRNLGDATRALNEGGDLLRQGQLLAADNTAQERSKRLEEIEELQASGKAKLLQASNFLIELGENLNDE